MMSEKEAAAATTPPGADVDSTPQEKRSVEMGDVNSRTVAIKPQSRLLHDPDVSFEEYLYYAERSRAEEAHLATKDEGRVKNAFKDIFMPSASSQVRTHDNPGGAATELNWSDPAVRATISDEEWANASRALRTASAAACFYLITTDIRTWKLETLTLTLTLSLP